MLTYNKDTSGLELYDGSAFGPVGSDAGLIHIETVSISAVSSVNIDNVFSATYDHYKLIATYTYSSTDVDVVFRLRVGGSNDTTSNYNSQRIIVADTSVTASRQTTQTSSRFFIAPSGRTIGEATIYNPFLAERTFFNTTSAFTDGSNLSRYCDVRGWHNATTSFDGINLSVGSGTLTGTLSIWGLTK
jgi:hypothetical protein